MVDALEESLASQNFSSLAPVPWKRVIKIKNEVERETVYCCLHMQLPVSGLHNFTDSLKQSESGADKLISELGGRNKHLLEAHAIVDQARHRSITA